MNAARIVVSRAPCSDAARQNHVLPNHRLQGHAKTLLTHAKAIVQAKRGHMILIDTSSLNQFILAKAFYLKHGCDEEARIRDYWKDGDDKVTFRKAF